VLWRLRRIFGAHSRHHGEGKKRCGNTHSRRGTKMDSHVA
jgi:hypothetical protein